MNLLIYGVIVSDAYTTFQIDKLTTHPLKLYLVDFLANPRITLDFLRIQLPFTEKSNLVAKKKPGVS